MKHPTWPTGERKSTDNAFSSWKDGTPSIFANAPRKTGPKTEAQALNNRHSGYYSRAGVV